MRQPLDSTQRLNFAMFALAAAILMSACGGASEPTNGATDGTVDRQAILMLVPFDEVPLDRSVIPDANLAAFRTCLDTTLGFEPISPAERDFDREPDEALLQENASSDCALEVGLDEFADIWTPPTPEEQVEQLREFADLVIACFEETGNTEPPGIDYGNGIIGPDLDLVRETDPDLADEIDLCLQIDHSGHDH